MTVARVLTSLDKFTLREDEPATAPVPDELLDGIGPRRLEVFRDAELVSANELCALLGRSRDGVALLPEGVTFERTARSIESITGLNVERVDALASNRPDWIPKVFNPRLAVDLPQRLLKSSSDRLVHPFVDERIYPPDDRVGYCPTGYPWTCIGKTFKDQSPGDRRPSGTAALVGVRSILTASHTLPPAAWSGGWWAMEFVPGYLYGMSLPHAGTKAWVRRGFGYSTNGVVGNDMVVLELDRPLGDLLGFFGAATYDDDWEDEPWWTHVGYPRALFNGENPCRQAGIAIVDDDSGPDDSLELEHFGDAGRGDSGGPLFGWWGDDPRIIGTLSGNQVSSGGFLGIGDEDHNVHAGGAALVRLVRHARDNWD